MTENLPKIKRLMFCQNRHVAGFNSVVIPADFFAQAQDVYGLVNGGVQGGISAFVTAVKEVSKAAFPFAVATLDVNGQPVGVSLYQFKCNIKSLAVGCFHGQFSFRASIA